MMSPRCWPQSSPKWIQSTSYSSAIATTFWFQAQISPRREWTRSCSSSMLHSSASMPISVQARSNSEKPSAATRNWVGGVAISFSISPRMKGSSTAGKRYRFRSSKS